MVIAVIAVLASLLLPSLKHARETARSVTCYNNLKQLGLGILMYTNMFPEYFPCYPYETWISQQTPELNRVQWYVDIAEYCGIPGQREKDWYARYYMKGPFSCPAIPPNPSDKWAEPRLGICYGANYAMHHAIMHGWSHEIAYLPRWRSPFRKIMLGDCGDSILHHQTGSAFRPRSWLKYRHLQRAQILFIDLHAGSESYVPWWYTEDYEAWWRQDG